MTTRANGKQKRAPIFDLELDDLAFEGELTTPIIETVPRKALHSAMTLQEWDSYLSQFEEQSRDFFERVTAKRDKKLDLLFPLVGIAIDDGDKWKKLALLLAAKYIPGFRVHDPSITNPLVWTPWRKADLVMQIRDEGNFSQKTRTSEIIRKLVKRAAKGDAYGTSLFSPRSNGDDSIVKYCRTLANIHSAAIRDTEVQSIITNLDSQHDQQSASDTSLAQLVTCEVVLRATRQAWTATILAYSPVFDVANKAMSADAREVFLHERGGSQNPSFAYSMKIFAYTRSKKPTT